MQPLEFTDNQINHDITEVRPLRVLYTPVELAADADPEVAAVVDLEVGTEL